jgi:predicted phage terminase large subunit-like protein
MSLKPSPQAAAIELLRRRKARTSLIEYARYIDVPGAPILDDETFEDDAKKPIRPIGTALADHHRIILGATQRCIERHSGRTMLFLPPGSAKSTYATVVAPTWVMGVKAGFKVICASYGSDLSRKFGRRTRSIIKQDGYKSLFNTTLSAESSAMDEWALDNGSEYMAGGLLSGMTGNRADFIPIDDPTKGRREAGSEATQKSTMEAYQDDLLTRLKPGGSLMLTQTRWDMNDLAGQILPENYNGESGMIECRDGNTWEVICIPAKCERADDPLGRKIGDYIWPEWFPKDHWKPFERIPRTWSALYQQRPSPESGDYFKAEWIKTVESLPEMRNMRVYGASDYAVTASGGDYTVHVVIGIDPDDRIYLLDLWRGQTSSDQWVESFCDLVLKWKPIGWAEETGQIKSGVGPFLMRRQLERRAYVYREAFPTRGDKAIRAQSIRGRIAMNGLHILNDAPFKADLISEMMSFPVGVHDDQVDALGLVGQLLDKMLTGAKDKIDTSLPKIPLGYTQLPMPPTHSVGNRIKI